MNPYGRNGTLRARMPHVGKPPAPRATAPTMDAATMEALKVYADYRRLVQTAPALAGAMRSNPKYAAAIAYGENTQRVNPLHAAASEINRRTAQKAAVSEAERKGRPLDLPPPGAIPPPPPPSQDEIDTTALRAYRDLKSRGLVLSAATHRKANLAEISRAEEREAKSRSAPGGSNGV